VYVEVQQPRLLAVPSQSAECSGEGGALPHTVREEAGEAREWRRVDLREEGREWEASVSEAFIDLGIDPLWMVRMNWAPSKNIPGPIVSALLTKFYCLTFFSLFPSYCTIAT
jgi:hypothetical protein